MQTNLTNRKRFASKVLMFFIVCACLSIASASIHTVFADGWGGAQLNDAFSIIQTVALAGGAVGIAYCGIQYMLGNEQESSKALSRGLLILGGVIAVYMLPIVVQWGKSIGQSLKWNPKSLK